MRTMRERAARLVSGFFSAYGMLAVLLLLGFYFAGATWHVERPTGREGGTALAAALKARRIQPESIVIVAPPDAEGRAFTDALGEGLRGRTGVTRVPGDPPAARAELARRAAAGQRVDLVATTPAALDWAVWDSLRSGVPALARLEVAAPPTRGRSTFLSPSNLRNVADQIAVIAIIAVGMTMVIITGGIDLSVGSLVALAAVVSAWLLRRWGGEGATAGAMLAASLGATALSGAVGLVSGLTVTLFRIPPFIATLAMMQVASGLAFIIAEGQSIYAVPSAYTWLGRGTDLASLPNAVVLMAVIYVLAHVLMTRTAVGRRIYAVGGNVEAARLSGVRVNRTLLFVYLVSGLMAGIGGVITVSQLRAGSPTYGAMYELYVIAAVVVGGTSLSGGEGRIFGTLIGAFIIAVIRNGMNLMNVEPYTQKVVLGLVILGAVLLDMLKQRRWSRRAAV